MGADVTMPLSELDALRDELKAAIARAAELEQKQSKIRVDVRERIQTFRSERLGFDAREIRPSWDWKHYPHEYINMEDVVGPIRDEERQKVQAELHEKDNKITELKDRSHKRETEQRETITKLKEAYEARIKELTDMQTEITKDAIIGNLSNELELLRGRLTAITKQTFWQRLFKPIKLTQI